MVRKYWYEEGMCQHLRYKGLWPVAYVSEDDMVYKKECMACREVLDGKCKQERACEVFKRAAEKMEKSWQLRDKKM